MPASLGQREVKGDDDGPKEEEVFRPVRRCLFGVDREANKRDLQHNMEKIEETNRCRWNFDFRECRPLEGQYLWEPVREDRNAMPGVDGATLEAVPLDCTNCDHPVEISSRDPSSATTITTSSSSMTRPVRSTRRQTTLRKYYRVRKRPAVNYTKNTSH